MTDSAHLFNPKDNSLGERVRAYKQTIAALRNVQASKQLSGDTDWSNRLGSEEELDEASDIANRSVDLAISSFSNDEIQHLNNQQLLSTDELRELVKHKRQREMDQKRSQSDNQSHDQGHKR